MIDYDCICSERDSLRDRLTDRERERESQKNEGGRERQIDK